MNFLQTLRKTARKNKKFLFSEKPQKGLFRSSKNRRAKISGGNSQRNESKSERNQTRSGGGRCSVGFGGCSRLVFVMLSLWLSVALCAPFVALVVCSYTPQTVKRRYGAFRGLYRGQQKTARHYSRAAMRSNMDLCRAWLVHHSIRAASSSGGVIGTLTSSQPFGVR